MAKKEKGGKGKGGKNAPNPNMISIAAHPRASRSIRRSKAWAGLIAFFGVGLLSYQAQADAFTIGSRALIAGIVFYLVVWAVSVRTWRAIVLHEAEAEVKRIHEEREEASRQLVAAQAAQDAGETA